MTDDFALDVDPAPDYAVIAADGAYANIRDGFISLLFFQDKSFPSHGEDGSIIRARTKREILHEVRLSRRVAKRLFDDIRTGTTILDDISLIVDERDLSHANIFGPDPQARVSEYRPIKHTEDEMERILALSMMQVLEQTNDEGRVKILELVGECMHSHLEDFQKIARQYPRKEANKTVEDQ